MADEVPEETPKDSEKTNPWGRMEDIIRKVVGEELNKWEVSPSDSQPSSKTPETPIPDSPPSSPKAPERTKGFLSDWFGMS